MKRGLVVFAWLASALLHAAVISALVWQPGIQAEIELPKSIQLVKLAPPRPEPVVDPTPPPPQPPPPKQVVKSKPEPKPAPTPVAKPAALPAPEPEPVTEQVEARPTPPAPAQPVAQPSYQPVDVGVAYLNNPKPPYPSVARRRGWEGTVILRLDLDENGNPLRVEVADSSGHNVLDKAALATVKRWRFQPAMRGGNAVAARNVRVPIQFSLSDG